MGAPPASGMAKAHDARAESALRARREARTYFPSGETCVAAPGPSADAPGISSAGVVPSADIQNISPAHENTTRLLSGVQAGKNPPVCVSRVSTRDSML